jgi:ADP-ribose pyrophosphatase YjhB (NUDIX family)
MSSFGTAHSQPTDPQPGITYLNPTPVVAAIVPVRAINPTSGVLEIGLLTIERGIEPQLGHLALPGGYLEYEDWRDGLLRELFEETTIRIDDTSCVTLQAARSIDQNRKIVLFGSVPPIEHSALVNFIANRECPRFEIIFEVRELAFATHTEMARRFFESVATGNGGKLSDLQMPKRPPL